MNWVCKRNRFLTDFDLLETPNSFGDGNSPTESLNSTSQQSVLKKNAKGEHCRARLVFSQPLFSPRIMFATNSHSMDSAAEY